MSDRYQTGLTGSENIFVQARLSPAWRHVRQVVDEYDLTHNQSPSDYFNLEDAWSPDFKFEVAGGLPSIVTENIGVTCWNFKGRAKLPT